MNSMKTCREVDWKKTPAELPRISIQFNTSGKSSKSSKSSSGEEYSSKQSSFERQLMYTNAPGTSTTCRKCKLRIFSVKAKQMAINFDLSILSYSFD